MTNPSTSASTSTFDLVGDLYIDPLLNELHQEWSATPGAGTILSFSFPWINGQVAYWQSNYSNNNEQSAIYHFGFNDIQMDAARNALQAWANVANLSFNEVPDTISNVGDFRFAFSSAISSGIWGWASYPNNYWANGADVWVNTTYASDLDWSSGTYNYEALMHEIGHGLGLKHPGNYGGSPGPYLPSYLDFRNYSIMSYNDTANNWYWDSVKNEAVLVGRETPMVYDIYAIQYLYGANTSYHAGNNTYTFSPNHPFYETIWDAGGNDTIDVSNFSLSCNINLNQGEYSTISYHAPDSSWYDGYNNLGIAFNVIIENAIGGTGDDIFIGNTANNMIDGELGIDTVYYSSDRNNYTVTKNDYNSFVIRDMTGIDGTDTIIDIEKIAFSDQVLFLDITKPYITFFSPADGNTNVALDANIVLTFNEPIKADSGAIYIRTATAAGVIVESFDVSTSSHLKINGNTLTIDPINDLSDSTQFYVTIDPESIVDLAGNFYTGTTTYEFTTKEVILVPEISPTDRVFNWGESAYHHLFPEHQESMPEYFGYYARVYSNGDALGEKDGNVFYYDGGAGGTGDILLVGTVQDYLPQAVAAGF